MFGAGTVATGARHIFFYFQFFLHPCGDLFQGKTDFNPEIRTPVHTAGTAGAAAAESTESTETSESITENISKHGKDVVHRHIASIVSTGSAYSGMPKLIISLTFFRITQYLISLCRLLEFFFSLFVTLVLVRMMLNGFLPVGFFYLLGGGRFTDFQYFVIISFRHNSFILR